MFCEKMETRISTNEGLPLGAEKKVKILGARKSTAKVDTKGDDGQSRLVHGDGANRQTPKVPRYENDDEWRDGAAIRWPGGGLKPGFPPDPS